MGQLRIMYKNLGLIDPKQAEVRPFEEDTFVGQMIEEAKLLAEECDTQDEFDAKWAEYVETCRKIHSDNTKAMARWTRRIERNGYENKLDESAYTEAKRIHEETSRDFMRMDTLKFAI